MNARFFRAFLPLACLLASANATAQTGVESKAPGAAVALQNRLTHTCKNMNPGAVFLQSDGGYQETAQGWFYKAEVHQSTNWPLAYCYYGLDMAVPSNRPVYSVHFALTGFNATQCTVSGKTVTCNRLSATLKQ